MIVKNESRVIERCLRSVCGLISHWTIVDTGSSDDTRQRIQQAMQDIPGRLHERPWIDFGRNRTEAIRLADGNCDYILVIDADMEADYDSPGTWLGTLAADLYAVRYTGSLDYAQHMLLRSGLNWRYEGVTHEYITTDSEHSRGTVQGLRLIHHLDGARRPEKFEHDVELLLKGLQAEPDNSRYMFYLAATYRDLKRWSDAIQWYRRRVDRGGWEEEVFYSRYMIGVCAENMGEMETAIGAYLDAWDDRPARAEPLYRLARHFRSHEQYQAGYLFASQAHAIPYPDDILFIEQPIYTYKIMDELSICAYWIGRPAEGLELCKQLLAGTELPDSERPRVEENLRHCESALR